MRAAWFSALALLFGCAAPLPQLRQHRLLTTPIGSFELEYDDSDGADETLIESSIQGAASQLIRWPALQRPVKVYLLSSQHALQRAVDLDYDWLHAWARFDEIFIQAPRSWELSPPPRSEVDELMLHELTHSLIYQAAAQPWNWRRKEIPVWFREGIASYIAHQESRWPNRDELRRFYDEHPGQDPLLGDEALYRSHSNFVYSAAHHAFAFLVRGHGEAGVRGLLQRMREGAVFPEALEAAIGISSDQFLDQFRKSLR